MTGRLEGEVCIITGTGGGMGRAAAKLFAKEGALVVGIDSLDAIKIAAILDLVSFALDMPEGLELGPETDGFDPAMAVLAADFLYTRAFQIVAGMENIALPKLLSDGTTRAAEAAVQANQYQRDPAAGRSTSICSWIPHREQCSAAAGHLRGGRASGPEAIEPPRQRRHTGNLLHAHTRRVRFDRRYLRQEGYWS